METTHVPARITLVRRQWRNVLPVVVVVGLWCAALVVDNLQH